MIGARLRSSRAQGIGAALLLFASAWESSAHKISALSVVTDFSGSGAYSFKLSVDVQLVRDPFGEGRDAEAETRPPADPDAPLTAEEIAEVVSQVRQYVDESLRFYFDDAAVVPGFRIEEETLDGGAADVKTGADPEGKVLPEKRYLVIADGRMPEGAKEFLLEVTPEAQAPVVFIVFKNGKPTRRSQVLYSGEFSRPIELSSLQELNQSEGGRGTAEESDDVSAWQTFWRYLVFGFEHILPKGLDHILFVLGLFLFSRRLGPLFWQVTAFTVAHSVTLALAVLGVVELPARVVEPVIALSIAYVAIENIFAHRMTRLRPLVVFMFGLVHGLGFAGVLRDLGLPENQLLPALVAFNVGVELGQLSVIGLAFLAVCWMWNRDSYRKMVVIPGSIAIAAVGLYWTVERIFL